MKNKQSTCKHCGLPIELWEPFIGDQGRWWHKGEVGGIACKPTEAEPVDEQVTPAPVPTPVKFSELQKNQLFRFADSSEGLYIKISESSLRHLITHYFTRRIIDVDRLVVPVTDVRFCNRY